MAKPEFIRMHCFGCDRISQFLKVGSGRVFQSYICLDCQAKVQRRELSRRKNPVRRSDRSFSRRTEPVYAFVGLL